MEQFVLFGDSITQQSCSQAKGFGLTPALQDGKLAMSGKWGVIADL